MKWLTAKKPLHGQARLVRRFLFLPRSLVDHNTGDKITRWFETAYIIQQYHGGFMTISGADGDYWIDAYWATDNEVKAFNLQKE